MFPPPLAAVSSDLSPPSPTVVEPTPSQLIFPNEFPYEFDFTDSTETEDETTDDEDDFLAGLTRRLALSTQRLSSPPPFVTEKAEVKPLNSTESTQSGLGSPNGPFSQAPSAPTSPFRKEEEDSLKVISAAAGEVAKIKMATKPISRQIPQNPNSLTQFPHQNAAFCDYSYYYWLWQSQYHRQFQSTTLQPALIANPYPVRSVFAAPNAVKPVSTGTGVYTAPNAVKQASTGTGVFLPRKYPNPSDSKKKSGGGCVKLPTKKVVHTKTKEVSGRCQSHSQASNKINQVGGGCLKEVKHLLPQEWMY
ncbi:hypothetical protein AALP_AA5G195500 [Arabis alpina]|uniref:Uncharacterized protein n=1 Tax=Arabis alpina TaxID=50452 RepID=A0A087GY52_ARAAL|nr:hypothetical protein AALP_AA5G195500 [Arabis alpina]